MPCTGAATTEKLPVAPVPISACPHLNKSRTEHWSYTSCSLGHITEVHPCIKRTDPDRQVMGMLLHYSDGHRECVGQYRLDWVAEPVVVGEMQKLYICCKVGRKGNRYVAAVTARAPGQAEGWWHDVAQSGTLEWWFSSRHSILYYDGVHLDEFPRQLIDTSIIRTGMLCALYEKALEAESESRVFWQAVLNGVFSDSDAFALLVEYSADGHLEVVLKRYDPRHDTLKCEMLWVFGNRTSGAERAFEAQALYKAKGRIDRDGLPWIWVLTTIDVSFRVWFVSREVGELQPVHGTTVATDDETQYIDADSAAAAVFPLLVQRVKDGIPFPETRDIPGRLAWLMGNSGGDHAAGAAVEIQPGA